MKKVATKTEQADPVREKRKRTVTAIICLLAIIAFFTIFAIPMGLSNAINTLMKTAYDLLISTVFYIMALAVIAGALSEIMAEFGVVDLINRVLSPLMKPLFGMPGASALGIVTTYLSDNPAILTLASDNKFRRYFKAYQVPALTNLGTSFGMGLIVTSFMLAFSGVGTSDGTTLGTGVIWAALCGNLGTVVGAIVSTRLMLIFMKRQFGKDDPAVFEPEVVKDDGRDEKPKGVLRVLNALMDGGKKGVDLGLAVIPGVLIICSVVMMLTKGMPEGGYTGGPYEGIGAIPWLADKINFLLRPLFGFASNEALGVPVTALGSAGAALPMIETIVKESAAGGVAARAILNDIAVFTAICMCWSGYLSTHVSMMDALKCNRFTGKAILCHTIGGLCAGIAAHWLFTLVGVIFGI
jgi:hypothetical protein